LEVQTRSEADLRSGVDQQIHAQGEGMRIRRNGVRKALAVTAAAVMLVVSTGVTTVLAVHDETFQLDGDVSASTTTNKGNPPHIQSFDWDSLFNSSGATVDPLPAGFEAAKLTKDFNNTGTTFLTNDTTTFATGSKDTLGIHDWQCNFDNNVNSKIDVMNAYATAYTSPSGDDIIYFALERNTNTGDANVAFWFLQDEVGCTSTGGAVDFDGEHHDGDLLIVSAFTNGGTVSTIDVYRWSGDDATGFLDPTPQAHGVDCRSNTLNLGGDPACAAANTANISTPWLTANAKDKVGHTLRTAEFFEGGVNLTDTGLGGKCFNTFIGDTRSSQSLTATLFDYATGTIGECLSSTTTQAKDGGGSSLTSAPIPATGTLAVKDTATVDVDGVDTFDGTVTFYLCGPSATTITTCATADGVQIGSAVPITADGSVDSSTAQLTSAGSYCWHAVFSGDEDLGVPGSEDNGTNECFVVNPLQPALTTQATSGPVDFGQPIADSVNLSGTANKPGTGGVGPGGTINTTRGDGASGTVSVVAYGPNSCSTVAFTSGTIAVSGDGLYGGSGSAFEFTPTAPGQYVFVASYSGDPPNTKNIAAGTCAGAPESEKVTVQQIPTEIKTKQSWIPNDTATVTSTVGNLGAGGSVAFSLYDNATCSGGAVYSETKSIAGGAPSEEVSTNNTTFVITTGYTDAAGSVAGPYSWKVVYTPAAGDTAHTGKQSACDAEHFSITYTNDPGPGSDLP
jgi:hypothetical protein